MAKTITQYAYKILLFFALMLFDNWILIYFVAMLISGIFTGILIPQILLIAFKKKLFDTHDERKIHQGVVPRLGGIAFMPVMFFTLLAITICNIRFPYLNLNLNEEIEECNLRLCCGGCAMIIMYLIGIADDLIGLRYRAKFIFQFLCAFIIISSGLYISDFQGVLGIHEVPMWIGLPFTVIVIVGINNAINLIDGVDGLASGLCAVAMITYAKVFYDYDFHIFACLACSCLGVLIPFFYYNVFGDANKHKKIFMGDTGALTLGIILSIFAIAALLGNDSNVRLDNDNQAANAIFPILIPCMDALRVFAHRIRNGKGPFLPDNNHIHHKLLKCGLRQRQTMITIITYAIFVSILSMYATIYVDINIVLFTNILLYGIINYFLSRRISNLNKQQRNK